MCFQTYRKVSLQTFEQRSPSIHDSFSHLIVARDVGVDEIWAEDHK